MFNSEFKLFEEREYNVIAIGKRSVWFVKAFLLRNYKTFIYKKKSRNRNTRIKIFWFFFKDMKNEYNIESR